MKILFDQNLSRKLVKRLADIFPNASHVQFHGLTQVSDSEIWEFAREIALGLELKFGDAGTNLLPEIEKIGDVDVLSTVLDAIAIVDTVEQLRQVYQTINE